MSAHTSQEAHKFKSIEEELNYLKERYHQLALFHPDSEDIESPPAKRPRLVSDDEDENYMDPLKKLPEPVANKILKYLKGKELLTAMEVSKSWRDFIKVRSALMDKLIFNPRKDCFKYPTLNGVYNEETKRSYKHMVVSLCLSHKYSNEVKLIVYHASTLETLTIHAFHLHPLEGNQNVKPCNFPKLRKLYYNHNYGATPFKLLDGSTFPEVTHLFIGNILTENVRLDEAAKFLQLFPRLKILKMDVRLVADDEFVVTSEGDFPKIKAFKCINFFSNFFKPYQSTLEEFELFILSAEDLEIVLQNYKNLKSLDIGSLDGYSERKFTRNKSIEILRIFNIDDAFSKQKLLQNILLALPSLKTLVLFYDHIVSGDTLFIYFWLAI